MYMLFSVDVMAFVIGLSQISSLFSSFRYFRSEITTNCNLTFPSETWRVNNISTKSVSYRCVIEVSVAFLCCHLAFWSFQWCKGFCHRTVRSVPFYTPVFRRVVLWYGDVRPSVRPYVRVSVRVSFMLWHIELKFGMSLSCYEHSIKF